MTMAQEQMLTERWYPLRHHPEHARLWTSDDRFRVVGAGRRSGKTELAKRFTVMQSITHHETSEHLNGFYAFAAPTHQQARDIYWEDAKALVPSWAVASVRESDLTIRLVNGTRIRVAGMDKPERIEGHPLDGIVLDEYAHMKPDAWTRHVRPALSTPGRPGWAWFVGVPRAAPHFKKLYDGAAEWPDWSAFHWLSEDILEPAEIAAAKAELDPLTYSQEYEASWLDLTGLAYYVFSRKSHTARLEYDPKLPLVFCFDFNVHPGVACVLQEQTFDGGPDVAEVVTAVIGEVWIPHNSNTPAVCRRLVQDWKHHKGPVHIYGDATGGLPGSAKVQGSDWDLVTQVLRPEFGSRLSMRVKRGNPRERARVNAVNARLKTMDGVIHMLIDPTKAPHVVADLESVALLEGGSGEIDKESNKELTHISDALGYYVFEAHRVGGRDPVQSEVFF